MPRPVEEKWSLTQLQTADITEADGTAAKWSDIWKYQVPTGIGHVLLPEHTFSAYLEDVAAQVGNGTCRLRIEVRDASEQDSKVVFGPALYVSVKDFSDVNKMAKLNLNGPIVVTERMYIVIVVNDDGAIDASDSYFELATARIRKTLT